MIQFMVMFVVATTDIGVFAKASPVRTVSAKTMVEAAKAAFNMSTVENRSYVAVKTQAGTRKIFNAQLEVVPWTDLVNAVESDTVADERFVCAKCGAKFTGEFCPAPHSRMQQVKEVKCLGVWVLVDGTNTKVDCDVVSKRTIEQHIEHNNRCDEHSAVYVAEQERRAKVKAEKKV